MNIIVGFEISFHKKGSLIDLTKYNDTTFLDIEGRCTFKDRPSSFSGEVEKFDTCLEPLDESYLLLRDLIGFQIREVSAIQAEGGEFFYDLEGEIYDVPYWTIYEDLIPTLKENTVDRYGVIHFVVSLLFVEQGSYSYEGEYDSHFEYMGIIDSGFDPLSILTKKTKERYLKNQEEIKQLYS